MVLHVEIFTRVHLLEQQTHALSRFHFHMGLWHIIQGLYLSYTISCTLYPFQKFFHTISIYNFDKCVTHLQVVSCWKSCFCLYIIKFPTSQFIAVSFHFILMKTLFFAYNQQVSYMGKMHVSTLDWMELQGGNGANATRCPETKTKRRHLVSKDNDRANYIINEWLLFSATLIVLKRGSGLDYAEIYGHAHCLTNHRRS